MSKPIDVSKHTPVTPPQVPIKPAEPKYDNSDIPGVVKGAKVRHKTLGEGEVISFRNAGRSQYIKCRLKGKDREFPYPDIFRDGLLEVVQEIK